MAWTTPKTWATNEVVTSANLNTHLRDNMLFVGAPPTCIVSGTGQSISNNVLTGLNAPTETRDTDGMHSSVTNNTRITINTAGTYLFSACIGFAPNAVGFRQGIFYKNGSPFTGGFILGPSPAGGTVVSFSQHLHLAVADFVEVFALQTSGGSLGADLHDFSCHLVAVP